MVTKWATLHILQKAVSSHPTGSEWHCTFCKRLSDHIFSYDQQYVSDISHFMKGSLITSFPANRKWVRLHILWKAVWSHLFLWPTACEWYCTFCKRQCHDSSHLFLWPTAREWHCTFCERYSHHMYLSLWPTVCEWHFTFCERQSDHIFPTNRKWVTLHILWKAVWSHLFLWPTACEWDCTFCERQSDHIFSYGQQLVSDIAHFVKGSLITSFPMTNRKWVTLHILWKTVSSHLFPWSTGCEWHHIFCEEQSHHIFPMSNRLWVPLHISISKGISSNPFLWLTGSEWYIGCFTLSHC